jgi:uncharacterized membrane protein
MVHDPREIAATYRRTFVRGLGALLPVVITIAVLAFLWNLLDDVAGGIAQALLSHAVGRPVPRFFATLAALPALALVCVVVGATVGGATLALAEEAVLRVPLARGIYAAARQVVARLTAPRAVTPRLARGVVVAPFGKYGPHFLGLLVGTRLAAVPAPGGGEAFPVFFSHAPACVTGFLILSREATIIPLEQWRLEDFARFYTSAGIARPEPGGAATA